MKMIDHEKCASVHYWGQSTISRVEERLKNKYECLDSIEKQRNVNAEL